MNGKVDSHFCASPPQPVVILFFLREDSSHRFHSGIEFESERERAWLNDDEKKERDAMRWDEMRCDSMGRASRQSSEREREKLWREIKNVSDLILRYFPLFRFHIFMIPWRSPSYSSSSHSLSLSLTHSFLCRKLWSKRRCRHSYQSSVVIKS